MGALEVNLADAAMAGAGPRATRWLNLLGQDEARGYRAPLRVAIPPGQTLAFSFGGVTPCEAVVSFANMLELAQELYAYLPECERLCLTDDQAADLLSFVVQRLRHNPRQMRAATDARAER
jgi:hypothetical protein